MALLRRDALGTRVWNGWEGTLAALRKFVRPGGIVVTGEPFWKQEPPAEYHAHSAASDLTLLWMTESSLTAWDRYETLQGANVDRFAREHPDHPDLEEIRRVREKADSIYFRWGRDCCGFAIWAFRVAGEAG